MHKFRYFLLGFAALALLLMSFQVKAEKGNQGDWEVGMYGGVLIPDNYGAFDLQAGPLVGARIGYFFSSHFSLEVAYQHAFNETPTRVNAPIDSVRFNGLLNFNPGEILRPFLTIGAGVEMTEVSGFLEDTGFGLNVGGGFRWFLTEMFAFRFDARYVGVKVGDVLDSYEHNFEVTGGFSWVFGEEVAETAIDSDTDGVTDAMDQCPATPTGTAVDDRGCPMDADMDGVFNHQDRCPGTAKGEAVDKMGCPAKSAARGVLEGVEFELNKAVLTGNAESELNGIALTLKKYPAVNVEVQGYTDNTGDADYNVHLSGLRAKAVVDHLVGQGIKAERLQAKGYGPAAPIADNNTREGRSKNRRVELKWLD